MQAPRSTSPRRNTHFFGLYLLLLGLSACQGTVGLDSEQGQPGDRPRSPMGFVNEGGAEIDGSWWGQVQDRIAADARAIRPTGESSFQADNSVLGFQVRFNSLGLELVERGSLGTTPIHLATSSFGREGALSRLPSAEPALGSCAGQGEIDTSARCVPRLEYDRGLLQEWWVNRSMGLEQGFTIEQAPSGQGALLLEIEVQGADIDLDVQSREIWLSGESGELWSYGQALAWDANGEPLDLSLGTRDGLLRLEIDDSQAVYPIEIDPVLTTYTTRVGGETANSYLGYSVAGAGDVNADGFDDIVVGAWGYGSIAGRVYVFHGSSTGVSSTATTTITGAVAGDQLGWSVSTAGDVNHDGFADIVVGAPGTSAAHGAIHIFPGSAAGVSSTASFTATGGTTYAEQMGFSVACAGDVNNDGYSEIITGAPYYNTTYGRVYLYYGSASGTTATGYWVRTWTSPNYYYGYDVAGAGDVNGDNYSDIMIAAIGYASGAYRGRVYVYHGTSGTIPTSYTTYAHGEIDGDRFGSSISGAGDVNGDGFDDIIIGAPNYGGNTGRAYVYHGSSTGLGSYPISAELTLDGQNVNDYFGGAVTGAGDINGDSYDDVLIGAWGYSTNTGRVYLHEGGAKGVDSVAINTIDGAATSFYFGASVAGAGDVNGDTFEDILVGAWGYSSNRGRAYVYHGYRDDDSDGHDSTVDCDDTDPLVNPAATETCNGIDDDCDTSIDEGVTTDFYPDIDLDTYGDSAATPTAACEPPSGFITDHSDCDDSDSSVHPGADESCNATDDDCDGVTDEPDAIDALTWYADSDSDSYGDPDSTAPGCTAPSGFIADSTDCDDSSSSVHPGASESFDHVDQDCDGLVDEDMLPSWGNNQYPSATSTIVDVASELIYGQVWQPGYTDSPGWSGMLAELGYGELGSDPAEDDWTWVSASYNVDDGNNDEFQATLTVGTAGTYAWAWRYSLNDGLDWLICDNGGSTPTDPYDSRSSGVLTVLPADVDGDGYRAGVDCDDTNASIHPGATETIADGIDQDCDSGELCYQDADDDGYGHSMTVPSEDLDCADPGESVLSSDCDDGRASINPAMEEICNGADDNCNGETDEGVLSTFYLDEDRDGFGNPSRARESCMAPADHVELGTDCDDSNAAINPSATEIVGDGVDSDCDGGELCFVDADYDSYRLESTSPSADPDCSDPGEALSGAGLDCDDSSASVNPGSTEIFNDIDDDCDGVVDDGLFPDWGNVQWPLSTTTVMGVPTEPLYGQVWEPGVTNLEGFGGELAMLGWGPRGSNPHVDATDWTWEETSFNVDVGENDELVGTLTIDVAGTYAWAFRYSLDGGVTWLYADTSGCTVADTYNPASEAVVTVQWPDADSDGYRADVDCDDSEASVYPGATETIADGIDQDCDGGDTCFLDSDGDTFGTSATRASTDLDCVDTGESALSTDCDDTLSSVYPDAVETCNEIDDDCDSEIDEGVTPAWYQDTDADTFGDITHRIDTCIAPAGYVADSTDCDDSAPTVYPGAPEVTADGIDQSCDGIELCHVDADDDGYRLESTVSSSDSDCSDAGEALASEPSDDCDDTDPAIHPLATEICNGLDDDCDLEIDEGVTPTWYRDADEDTFGDSALSVMSCSALPGYVADATDCDDTSNTVYPGATEIEANGIDESCDGQEICDVDSDDDGWRLSTTLVSSDPDCDDSGEAYAHEPTGDCDDTSSAVNPDAIESCNGVDDDCDSAIDESGSTGEIYWYADLDADGYANASAFVLTCYAPEDHISAEASLGEDCDDSNGLVNPGATEACNTFDDDCDGETDESGSVGETTWCQDSDSDGHGTPGSTLSACAEPTGFVVECGDCDDTNDAFYPGAPEDCGEPIDYNCDGTTGYADDDLDGWAACEECDDSRASVYPGAPESCNEIDDDCDGDIDEDVELTFYLDADSDGYGIEETTTQACTAPYGYVAATAAGFDCNDTDADYHPGAPEDCTDPEDYNCDGSTGYADADGDGAAACEDCDDFNDAVHPGAAEYCNGIDDDCDRETDESGSIGEITWYADLDLDSYSDPLSSIVSCDAPDSYIDELDSLGWDCDDTMAEVNPAAIESCNGIDDDCDGEADEAGALGEVEWYVDTDGDLYALEDTPFLACEGEKGWIEVTASLGWDCDDSAASVFPGAEELCNGIDDDCDEIIDGPKSTDTSTWYADADDDGATNPKDMVEDCAPPEGYGPASKTSDCDDNDPDRYPGNKDIPGDEIDQDCDGVDAEEPDTSDTGDTSDTSDTSDTEDTNVTDDTGPGDTSAGKDSCGCATSEAPLNALWLLGGLAPLLIRRRRGQRV